jgi:methionyl-tRNA formyltransferase
MHGSLLPKYRGRAPVNWVLVEGETVTGVTLHVMDPKPDRGDIVGQREIPIADDDTARTLHGKTAAAAGELLRELWPRIEGGTETRTPQDPEKATYRGRRGPEDGRLDFTRPARTCWNLVRAVTHPYPGAFTVAGGKKLFVWKASLTGQGAGAPGSGLREPGRVLGVVPGRGVLVRAGDGAALLFERVQLEGDVERAADALAETGALSVGLILG